MGVLDFIQDEILGMKWLGRLIGSLLNACGLDTGKRLGAGVQFFIYDVIKIMVLLGVMIFIISSYPIRKRLSKNSAYERSDIMDMKISDITSVSSAAVTKKTEKASSEEFSFTLNKVSDDKLMERLNSLMEDIAAQGKKLGEHMDIRDMKKYRSLVTDFINEVVTNSHEFSRENFLDRRGRHRVYGIVKLVNKGLDDLAQELLKKEKDHIAILDKTDEIQGLLMDIMI